VIAIDNFSIETHEGDYENRPLKSALYFNDKRLNVKVSGYVIEKQLEMHSYLLASFSELSPNQYQLVFNESDCYELIINYPKKHLFSKVVYVNKID
jgi:hypothetical protein